jgi:hypothetical protein
MQEAARRSGHIADAVYGNKEHGFYFTLGHQHDQGIYIPAHEGIAKLDPHDTTTTYSYTRPDGTTGTITNADLFNSLVNKKVFDGLDKGDVGFELHHHRDALNLNDGVNNGHYEAVIVGQHADGTLEHEIVATGIGSSSASEGIDFTEQSAIAHITAQSHTERIFEVIPPLHLPEDVPGVEGSPASLEFALFAAPTYLDKERSITGDTAGKVSNIPQGVSFAGGDVVDSPLPKPKTGDGTGTGDETGKKDESADAI